MGSFSREILWLKKKKRISRRVHIVIEILNFKDMFRRENMQIWRNRDTVSYRETDVF